ncbi:MAG TPA: histidinol-phosphatase, partial [Dehalococcoidia bacterium]
MFVDGHVHLQPHGQKPPVDRARIELYVEHAQRNGVDVVVFTEHLFRFVDAYNLLEGWWDADPNPAFAAITKAYWQDHANLSLSEYVRLIEAAKAEGLPVRLGLEMDWIPGRADDLRRLLEPYAWDCVLGSVHYLGAFGIDMSEFEAEWANRNLAAVWAEYADFIEDLAGAGLCDVLAHPDVVKVWGHVPPDRSAFDRRIVEAARANGLALEINTNGLNKPVAALYPSPELLQLAREAGVPVTLASDAHYPERIGQRFDAAA